GEIVALDTPANLISRVRGRGARINLTTLRPLDLNRLSGGVPGIVPIKASINGDARYVFQADNTGPAVGALVNSIEGQHNELLDLQIVRASLEDAFVELTGKGM